jgi:peroxiredoxin
MILVLAFFLRLGNLSYAGEKAPSFILMQWGTEKQVSLDDFRGKIVVLDFFNASCGVCFRASWEIMIGIQGFYAKRSGNSHGIPVHVVALNTEVAEADDMNAFIQETELGLALDDSDGAVLQRYGGTTVPYLVVIDATGTDPNDSSPRVVYRQAGYEGVDKLRDAIDSITGHAEPKDYSPVTPVDTIPEMSQRITHETALDTAALIAQDVFVTDTLAEYHRKSPEMDFTLGLSYRRIEIDYSSEYFLVRREKQLTSDWFGLQSSASFDLNKALTFTVEGGIYDGYQTYRALWLDKYYRHAFEVLSEFIEDLNGYQKADPWGYNVSNSLRWEYLADAGFAEAGISYQHDVVSPGYEMGVEVVRLRDTYDTISGRLRFENILTRRLRTLAECQIQNTTDRNVRFTLQGALNYALGEHWVTRLVLAGSKEEPNFTSKSVSAVFEYDWHSTWFLSIFGRYYEDTSEIANAIVSNAAAPPIDTYQAGLGLRRQGHRSSFKIVVGPCYSRYERQPQRDTSFDQLYKDRNWLSVQFAFLYQF